MRIDENLLLMRSKTFFRAQQSLDWKEIAELTAGILDRWQIKMALFHLDDNGWAHLKFHSLDTNFERWWQIVGGESDNRLSIEVSKMPPMENAINHQQVVFVSDLKTTMISGGGGAILRHLPHQQAVFAPLMNEGKPFGVLVAMSPELKQDDTLIVSLIAHELSTLIGGSELIMELRKSEMLFKRVATKYRDLIDRLDDAIIMADGEGKILAVNESMRSSLNYTYQEITQLNLRDLVHARDHDLLGRMLDQAKKTATLFEIQLCGRGGKPINTEAVLTYSPEANTFQGMFREEKAVPSGDNGDNVRWLENVTEKRSRKKKDCEVLMEGSIDRFPGFLFFMNPEGKIVFINSSAEKVTGYAREDFMKHPLRWLERVHPEDREKIALEYQKAILTGEGHNALHFKFVQKFGKTCDFISSAIPLRDVDGKLVGIEGIFQEITPILEAEREREADYDSQNILYDNLSELIFVFDPAFNIRMMNRSCNDLFGLDVVEMVGMPLSEIVAEADMATLHKGVRIATEKGQVEGLVIRAYNKGGEEIFLEINMTPVMEDETPVAMRCIARNVTERVRLEEHGKELQKQLVQKEKLAAIGELLATVSHGIRNPLASIRAVAQATSEEMGHDATARMAFKNVILEVDRLEMRIKEFLSFYRPFEPDLREHRINDIITEALAMVAGRNKESNLKLDMKLDWDIPPLLLDFAQIEQVLLNLIGNAFGAMTDGGSLRVTSARVFSESGERAEISIEDSGQGIPDSLKERIFQPFFTTKAHGTGMGLSVSKKIIENHGGRIVAEDSELGGAKILFWIPILELEDDA